MTEKKDSKTIVEEIDSILEADSRESYVGYESINEPLYRIVGKLDTLNQLIALALKQKYGRQK
jgi:hypothetical protein